MKLHREGYFSIILITFITLSIAVLTYSSNIPDFFKSFSYLISIVLFLIVYQFFRNPMKDWVPVDNVILCPADGKVVVIEEVEETEYFHDKRIQVSVFMSPVDVHVNRNPVSGVVKYYKYHPGKFLFAWHPKSSVNNERTTIVVEDRFGRDILFRQIAGALARRIVSYVNENKIVVQGQEFGFIKFGSRVDLFLPLDFKTKVNIGDKVIGGKTIIGEF